MNAARSPRSSRRMRRSSRSLLCQSLRPRYRGDQPRPLDGHEIGCRRRNARRTGQWRRRAADQAQLAGRILAVCRKLAAIRVVSAQCERNRAIRASANRDGRQHCQRRQDQLQNQRVRDDPAGNLSPGQCQGFRQFTSASPAQHITPERVCVRRVRDDAGIMLPNVANLQRKSCRIGGFGNGVSTLHGVVLQKTRAPAPTDTKSGR